MPAPQQNLLSPGVSITWLNSVARRLSVVLVVFLTCGVPLSSPSTSPRSVSPHSQPHSPPLGHPPPCPEARRWPTFCSALMNTSILNETSRDMVRSRVHEAQTMFCDMIRVLNKIDCAQPFTVNTRWRIGCQEAYRDWSCSLLAENHIPPGLRSCDSTCHQVIRVCPYLSPDRLQNDLSGKPSAHPSQYGGHPAFYCPTTFSHEKHTEDVFFSDPPAPAFPLCILFNPADAGLNWASFPLTHLHIHNLSFTLCQEYSNLTAPDPLHLLDRSAPVNVTQCCWTYNTALPKTYSYLSATLQRRVLADENCVPLSPTDRPLDEPEVGPTSRHLHEQDVREEQDHKHIILQCLVEQERGAQEEPALLHDGHVASPDDLHHYYVDDEPVPEPLRRSFTTTASDRIIGYSFPFQGGGPRDDEDPSVEGYNSAEAEAFDSETDYGDSEYEREDGVSARTSSTRRSASSSAEFITLMTQSEPTPPAALRSSTSGGGRGRRAASPPLPPSTSGARNLLRTFRPFEWERGLRYVSSCCSPHFLFLLLLSTTNLLPLVLLGIARTEAPPRPPLRPPLGAPRRTWTLGRLRLLLEHIYLLLLLSNTRKSRLRSWTKGRTSSCCERVTGLRLRPPAKGRRRGARREAGPRPGPRLRPGSATKKRIKPSVRSARALINPNHAKTPPATRHRSPSSLAPPPGLRPASAPPAPSRSAPPNQTPPAFSTQVAT